MWAILGYAVDRRHNSERTFSRSETKCLNNENCPLQPLFVFLNWPTYLLYVWCPPPTSSLCWTVLPLSCSNHPISWLFGLHSIGAGWISITFPQVCQKQCKRRPFGHIYFPCGNLFCNTNSQNKGMERGGGNHCNPVLLIAVASIPHLTWDPATLHCQWLFCLWLLEAASCVSVDGWDIPIGYETWRRACYKWQTWPESYLRSYSFSWDCHVYFSFLLTDDCFDRFRFVNQAVMQKLKYRFIYFQILLLQFYKKSY